MADTVVTEAPTTEEAVLSVLDQYQADMAVLDNSFKEANGQVEKPTIEEKTEEPKETAPTEVKFDIDAALKDPASGPKLQSMIDRRVEGMRNSIAEDTKRRINQEAYENARKEQATKAQADYENLVKKANEPDEFDDEVIEARKKLAQMTWQNENRSSIERELTPHIEQTVLNNVQDYLASQYDSGLKSIPELKGFEFSKREWESGKAHELDWRNFQDAGQWLVKLVDNISDKRFAASEEKLRAQIEKELRDTIDTEVTAGLAAARSNQPNPDIARTPVGGNPSGPRILGQYKSQREINADIDILAERYNIRTIRAALERLPY